MSTLQRLTDRGLVRPPRWLPNAVQYETIMGSVAYGVSSDTSDLDVYGWAIPPKDDVFPHLRGEVPGFGTPKPQFQQYQEHHVVDHDALGGRGRTRQPYPLIFATISGAHLYGFPSPDSDFDLRGCHVLPAAAAQRGSPTHAGGRPGRPQARGAGDGRPRRRRHRLPPSRI
jgi:hypothetical protein